VSADRNAPCPCGSGKKWKKCCLLTPSGPPCDAWEPSRGLHCQKPSSGRVACRLCDKKLHFCPAHENDCAQNLRGHILRVHPESLPGVLDDMIRHPHKLEAFKAGIAPSDPSMWTHFFEVLERRRKEKAN
jgi:hypothetical protein